MGALEGLGGQILDTFVKSEAWGGGPGAEGIGMFYGFLSVLGPPKVLSTYYLRTKILDLRP